MPEETTDHRRATANRNVEAILDAARSILERNGTASIAAVAAEAGVSRVTVYAHFKTREELLEAVVARAVDGSSVALEQDQLEAGTATEALERLVLNGWADISRTDAIAHAASAQLSHDAMVRSHDAARQSVRSLVERGRASSEFRTDVPVEWLVTSCFTLMHACADDVRAGRLEEAEALEALNDTMRRVFFDADRL